MYYVYAVISAMIDNCNTSSLAVAAYLTTCQEVNEIIERARDGMRHAVHARRAPAFDAKRNVYRNGDRKAGLIAVCRGNDQSSRKL